MSTTPSPADGSAPASSSARDRGRVVFATIIGTTVEWYDFFIFAIISARIFGDLFFQGFGDSRQALTYLTMGLSFLFRPLGAFLAGHLGDRFGRKVVLTATLILMGASTTLIGVLPTWDDWMWGATILVVFLRILQGISAGGEWGGAVLLAVEHAPTNKRGIFGASPQIGVPIGLILANLVIALVEMGTDDAQWLSWGWRIPFLLSAVMIFVGYFVRRSVEESPVFAEVAARKATSTAPVKQLFAKHALLVILAAMVFAGNNAIGYMSTGGFFQKYATNTEGPLGFDGAAVSWCIVGAGFFWLIFTWLGGYLSDTVGRRRIYIIGWVTLLAGVLALFPIVAAGTLTAFFIGISLLTIGLGLTYGPQSALYAELFPASIRFSGVSISYAIGAICGGAFAPLIADTLVNNTGEWAVTVYLSVMVFIGLTGSLMLRDRQGIPLGPEHEEEQAKSPIYGRVSA